MIHPWFYIIEIRHNNERKLIFMIKASFFSRYNLIWTAKKIMKMAGRKRRDALRMNYKLSHATREKNLYSRTSCSKSLFWSKVGEKNGIALSVLINSTTSSSFTSLSFACPCRNLSPNFPSAFACKSSCRKGETIKTWSRN